MLKKTPLLNPEKAFLPVERVLICQLEANTAPPGLCTFEGAFLNCKAACQSNSTWGNFVFH